MEQSKYFNLNCPNCGQPLEVYQDFLTSWEQYSPCEFPVEERELVRHCAKCHLDWENKYISQYGDISETKLQRKFWG